MKLLRAKNFKLLNEQDKIFDLFKYQGKNWLLLVFFRGEWCQYCRRQLTELNNNYQWFKRRNIKLLAISTDNNLYTNILKEILNARFTILSDSEQKAFKIYGFNKVSDPKKINPAVYILNPQHYIIYKYLGKTKQDRPPLKKIKRVFLNEKVNDLK